MNEILILKSGGAATIVRTISRYPQWFRNRAHVFCNSVIGDFGESKVGVKKYFENLSLILFIIRFRNAIGF